MPVPESVNVTARSAGARMADNDTAELLFVTKENRSLHVTLPRKELYALGQRIMELMPSPPPY